MLSSMPAHLYACCVTKFDSQSARLCLKDVVAFVQSKSCWRSQHLLLSQEARGGFSQSLAILVGLVLPTY